MYTMSNNDVLEFKVDYKVKYKVKEGFLGWRSMSEDYKILNDGKLINYEERRLFIKRF